MNLRERKKLAVWQAIRTAALELFDEFGYEAVTVEQIAAAANVSRGTFFNYFASKEAAVFDHNPEERDQWQRLMSSRPEDEPLWDSLTAIIMGWAENMRQRMPVQRRLKAQSPALAQSTQHFGEVFVADLRGWVTSRTAEGDELNTTLELNLAIAATRTAYQTWREEEPFDDYLQRIKLCLHRAGAAARG